MGTSTDDEAEQPAADMRSARECFDAVASRYPRAETRPSTKEQGLAVADDAFDRALEARAKSAPVDGDGGK